ncbi:MAG: DsbC family protein [Nitrospinae bacterium]|nr:DsbC family protein [Nitrospinota bacterium]
MKKVLFAFLALCVLTNAYLPEVSAACGPECGCAAASSPLSVDDAGKAFKAAYPNTPIDKIKPGDREGRYVIHVGPNIFYFEPPNTVIMGKIIQNGVNITAKENEEMAKEADKVLPALLKSLPLDKAVKIGQGKKTDITVIEVSDPDCGFCRQAHEWFDANTALTKGVTRYVFFLPLHPDAPAKSKLILCSKDRAKAYGEVYGGKRDADFKTLPAGCDEKTAEALLQEHLAAARKLNVRGTPNFFIRDTRVPGANMTQVEALIKTK